MRTVIESARTMWKARNLGNEYWAETINTGMYVLNRTCISSIKDTTPYELWFRRQPDLTELQTFGSNLFANFLRNQRRKWDAKSKRGIFYERTMDVARDDIFRTKHPNNMLKVKTTLETESDIKDVERKKSSVALSETEDEKEIQSLGQNKARKLAAPVNAKWIFRVKRKDVCIVLIIEETANSGFVFN